MNQDIARFFAKIGEPKRSDLEELHNIVRRLAPEFEPFLFGEVLAFGKYHYKYATGREGDWFRIGLACVKTGMSLYVCVADKNGYLAEQAKDRIGKAIVGKSCIRFRKLADLNLKEIEALISHSVDCIKKSKRLR